MPMRIAFITTDAREHSRQYGKRSPFFGAAPEALLDGLAQRDDLEVHVISCAQEPMLSPEKLAGNIWFHSLLVPKLGWMRTGYQGCVRAVRRRLRDIRPDIVHGQGTERECALAAVFSGYPNVLTIHGNMVDIARIMQARPFSFHWLAARLENVAFRRTAGVFCNSLYTQSIVQPRVRRTWLVPNALRPEFFTAPLPANPSRKCILLHVGVVGDNKQQLKVLAMARRLHVRGLAFEVHFIGDANAGEPYSAQFLSGIADAERVGFARHLDRRDVRELITCFDGAAALVHTPRAEAFGLVVAEALARNLKFFGLAVGGVPDIATGVEGAELVPSEDWAALETRIGNWVQNGWPRPRQARDTMEKRYAPAVIAERHTQIYQEVLLSSRRSRSEPKECR